jgi:hypothetical protein
MPNVKKPAEKRKLTHGEKVQRDKHYDKEKRQRKWLPSWQNEYPWLRCDHDDDEGDKMYCSVCEQFSLLSRDNNTFLTGNSSFRVEGIRAHAKTLAHENAVCAELAKKKRLEDTPMGIGAKIMNSKASAKLSNLFRTAHALAMKSRPFTDFIWQCKLDTKKGVDIGRTYHTDKKCKEFIDSIAEVERRKMEDSIANSKFLSFMCDESTDSAITEECMIFLRSAKGGKINTYFLAIESLERANAENIYKTLYNSFESNLNLKKMDITKKLVGMATDGAAVLQGVRTGVAARMREDQPAIQVIHCMAHRLELALKDVLKNQPESKKVDTFLLNIYLFYHQSPTQRSLLKVSATALAVTHIVPTRVGGTRWVAHTEHSLDNLWKAYKAIVQHCEQVS